RVSLRSNFRRSLLADRAEERRSQSLDDPPDRAVAAARRAALAGAIVDAEIVLETAELAVSATMIAQRRAARLDGLAEHRLDRVDERVRALVRCAVARRDRRRLALGRQMRAVQRFTDVDVAEASDDLLVGERRLQAGLAPRACLGQQRRTEFVAERLRTDRLD